MRLTDSMLRDAKIGRGTTSKAATTLTMLLFAASACHEDVVEGDSSSELGEQEVASEDVAWETNPFKNEIVREAQYGISSCEKSPAQLSRLAEYNFDLIRCDREVIFVSRNPSNSDDKLLPASIAGSYVVFSIMETRLDTPSVRRINDPSLLKLTGPLRQKLAAKFDFRAEDETISVSGLVTEDADVVGGLKIMKSSTICDLIGPGGPSPVTVCQRFDGQRLFTFKSQSLSFSDSLAALDQLQNSIGAD